MEEVRKKRYCIWPSAIDKAMEKMGNVEVVMGDEKTNIKSFFKYNR